MLYRAKHGKTRDLLTTQPTKSRGNFSLKGERPFRPAVKAYILLITDDCRLIPRLRSLGGLNMRGSDVLFIALNFNVAGVGSGGDGQ
jgi:hypothetical protein